LAFRPPCRASGRTLRARRLGGRPHCQTETSGYAEAAQKLEPGRTHPRRLDAPASKRTRADKGVTLGQPEDPSGVITRFSTDDVPEKNRVATLHDVLGRVHFRAEIEPLELNQPYPLIGMFDDEREAGAQPRIEIVGFLGLIGGWYVRGHRHAECSLPLRYGSTAYSLDFSGSCSKRKWLRCAAASKRNDIW
jgi:hypothetical protein